MDENETVERTMVTCFRG